MVSKVLSSAALDEAARYIEPNGAQNFCEVRAILEENSDYTAQFIEYLHKLNEMATQLVDPNVKISSSTEKECKRLDKEQDALVKKSPDDRISSYLISRGHILGVKDISDSHYRAVQEARKRRSFFQIAAQYIEPLGGNNFLQIHNAFLKDSIFTGEFIGYHDAVDKFKKEIIETSTQISSARLDLLNQLHAELLKTSPSNFIKQYLVTTHEKLKQMNKKMK